MASLAVMSLALGLYGCGGGGSKSSTQTQVRTTTLGQELDDLKKAYDSGALSEKEYNTQREKILERED